MNHYSRKRKTDVADAYLCEGWQWHPVKISTDATILIIKRKSGKRQALSLYCCRLFRLSFFPGKKGLLVLSFEGTIVLGFDEEEERKKWDGIFRALRTIEANVLTYTARPVQYVASKPSSEIFRDLQDWAIQLEKDTPQFRYRLRGWICTKPKTAWLIIINIRPCSSC